MIKNMTFESTYSFYNWPRPYRLEYKIMNHDDLLSYAQFDIVDTEVRQISFEKLQHHVPTPSLINLVSQVITFFCMKISKVRAREVFS